MLQSRYGSESRREPADNPTNKTKLVCLTNIISPYRIPLFNRLAQDTSIDFSVLVLSEKEANREWQIAKEQIKFDYHVLRGLHKFIWSKEIPVHLNWGLWRSLRRYNPDVVVTSGYDTLAYWEAFLYCKLFKKKYILWNGTTLLSVGTTKGLIGGLKRWIIKGADQYVAYGTKAAEYLEYMGATRERINVGVNTVDIDWYKKKIAEARAADPFNRERSGYPSFLMLYVGRLSRAKGILGLLRAIEKLSNSEIGLMIVGSGPQEAELKQFCRAQRIQNVSFEGFQQQDTLPRFYALADVLILPTLREVWGLVVNEALASGLYVLCSDRAGAAYDLIQEEWNGALFDPHNVEQLARLIQETKDHIEEIRVRREAISEHACREFSIERSAKAFLDAIEFVRKEQA